VCIEGAVELWQVTQLWRKVRHRFVLAGGERLLTYQVQRRPEGRVRCNDWLDEDTTRGIIFYIHKDCGLTH
jgi:hypothetical protein